MVNDVGLKKGIWRNLDTTASSNRSISPISRVIAWQQRRSRAQHRGLCFGSVGRQFFHGCRLPVLPPRVRSAAVPCALEMRTSDWDEAKPTSVQTSGRLDGSLWAVKSEPLNC